MLVTAFNVTMTSNVVNNIFQIGFGVRGKCPEDVSEELAGWCAGEGMRGTLVRGE
jgi:hypothetical protein